MNLSGNPIDYIWAFLGGIAVSFSPCVYPLLPVSVGFITANAAGSRLKGFLLSVLYTLGVAIVYSALGLFASLSGKIFGFWVANPLTDIAVGVIIILFGVTMLDIFHISLPSFVHPVPARKKDGYISALFLGLSSGLVISPCISPVLGSILAFLATKKNIFYGASILFVFACGMGLIFVLAGTFTTVLTGLPRSGKWMVYVKRACGLILIAMGIYFAFNGIRRL